MFQGLDFTSNLDRIVARLGGISESLRGDDDQLIEDVQDAVGQGMKARAAREMDPHGSNWDENGPAYKARKGGLPVGVLEGEMLSLDNLRGNVAGERDRITIRYAGSSFARQKLMWFQQGGRIAWGLDEEIKRKIIEACGARVSAEIHGGGSIA